MESYPETVRLNSFPYDGFPEIHPICELVFLKC